MKELCVFAALAFVGSGAVRASCIDTLASYRKQTEADYLRSDDSPFDAKLKATFAGFKYFDGDQAYCVQSTFEPLRDAKVQPMPTLNGKSLPFREYGVFHFRLNGAVQSLTAYQRMDLPEKDRRWVLIPFRDLTNNHETYGGGRYLQLDLPLISPTMLDFNRAFNPLCAYDARFTCPMVPANNWLKTRITAGEMNYPGSH